MKQKAPISPPAIGGSSLLVIFAVLCLTVLSLLSLSTVQAEKRLSDIAASSVTAYYEADLEAQAIFARLRAGETVPGVEESEGIYRYVCAISPNQHLEVALRKEGECWTVLRWQTAAQPEEISTTLPVWDGGERNSP